MDTDIQKAIDSKYEELAKLQDERNSQYWTFTRSKNGKPVDPALTRQIGKIEKEIFDLKNNLYIFNTPVNILEEDKS